MFVLTRVCEECKQELVVMSLAPSSCDHGPSSTPPLKKKKKVLTGTAVAAGKMTGFETPVTTLVTPGGQRQSIKFYFNFMKNGGNCHFERPPLIHQGSQANVSLNAAQCYLTNTQKNKKILPKHPKVGLK